jgi:multidrug resistance efflux pump
LIPSNTVLADSPETSKANADKKPETESAKPKTAEPLKIKGVFEATESAELKLENKHFSSLKIERLVPHGTNVKKQQTVVGFETESLDEKIKDAERALRLAKLQLEDDEFAFDQFVQKQTLDREAAKRTRDRSQQAYDNYNKIDRDRRVLSAEFSLKASKAGLENVQEELKQLQQMYQEDDLTEESEEIVLKRAKQAVESAQFRFDGTKISTERTMKQGIPQSDAEQTETLKRAMMIFESKMRDLDSARVRKEIEIEKKRESFDKEKTELDEMRTERQAVVLKSPIDGIVLLGKLNRGRLGSKPSPLKVGSTVKTQQVIATVVDPNRLQVRVSLSEKNRMKISVGDRCDVIPTAVSSDLGANGDQEPATGKVSSITSVPYVAGAFDCVVSLDDSERLNQIVPTMTCELQFTAKQNETKQDTDANPPSSSDTKSDDDENA